MPIFLQVTRFAVGPDKLELPSLGPAAPGAPPPFDAFVISGSRHGVYEDEPWVAALLDWVRAAHRAEKRLLGVCFGHQARPPLRRGGWDRPSPARPRSVGRRRRLALRGPHAGRGGRMQAVAAALGGRVEVNPNGFEIGSCRFPLDPEARAYFSKLLRTAAGADGLPPGSPAAVREPPADLQMLFVHGCVAPRAD